MVSAHDASGPGSLSLRPLFPVDDVLELSAGRPSPPDGPRHGHVWPIAVLFCSLDEQPTIAVELAFYPVGDLPETLGESWPHFRDGLGLKSVVAAGAFRNTPDGSWSVDFGPHTFLYYRSRPFQMILPRPTRAWEDAIRANGSCLVVFGTGLAGDDNSGAIAIPMTAATTTASYAGSRVVPELSEISGLYVVPVNSFRPYDPMKAATFLLDTDVLIAMQRFCFAPTTLGAKLEAVRHVLVNTAGCDILPGPALAQLYQPSRTRLNTRATLEAFAAFDLLRSLSRTDIMDPARPPETFDTTYKRDVSSMAATPQMLMMYAGVLKLRSLWHPGQTLAERAESFESFMHWLRFDLRVNAALLVQVAFNLWISDDDAKRQASRLVRFRADTVTTATLAQLWGTAFDLFLLSGQADTKRMVNAVDVFILTFDRGLAGMRDFFEHLDDIGEVATTVGPDPAYGWNTRMKMNFHPRLEHMKPRVAELKTDLLKDMFARLAERGTKAYPRSDLLEIVEQEEHYVLRTCDT